MADTWGGIARAVEEGLDRRGGGSYSDRMHEEMYPGHRQAAREANAHGIMGLISGRHRGFIEDNKARMRELGITPSHTDREGNLTGRYSSGDWAALQDALAGDQAVVTALGPENRPVATPIGDPSTWGDSPNKNTIDPAILDKLRREPAWIDRPSQSMGIQDRFGDRTFSPRRGRSPFEGRFDREAQEAFSQGVTGYLPGRMSVGEARRARAMRNMSIRDRQEAGFGEGMYDDSQRRARSHDMRHGRLMNRLNEGSLRAQRAIRLADLALGDTTGTPGMGGHPSENIGSPNWAALEEDMARRAMRDEFIGRDDR